MRYFLPNFLFLVLIRAFLANCCIEHERHALLKFKGSVDDPSNRLASWTGNECCNWAGIRCSNRTGRVVSLDLASTTDDLSGKISPALCSLSDLKHLDLSYNDFYGLVPLELGNLSKLQYVNLNDMPNIFVTNMWWLSQLTSLKYLAMEEINFLQSREWVEALNTLPLLQSLHIGGNNLTIIPASINGLNFSSLKILSVRDNNFNTRIPDWIGKLTQLTTLQLSNCSFVGPIPNELNNLTSLENLEVRGNNMQGPMPALHNIRNLIQLSISDVDIGEDIGDIMSKLANKTLDQLEFLGLSNNSLTGNLTGWMGKLRSLNVLHLYYNYLNGTIPTEIGNITSLEILDLTANSLTGKFSKAHLTGLTNLIGLYLDFNNVTITVSRNWVPPFQLEVLELSGCKLGPHFPPWLQNQTRMHSIDLSNTGIVDIVPNWFWNYSDIYAIDLSDNQVTGILPLSLENLKNLNFLDLSNNLFEGGLPSLPHSIMFVILSYNLLSGPLPHHIAAPYLSILDLSNNLFNGTIENLTCGLDILTTLYLEQNNLSGNLPHCWPSTLEEVNMAHNLLNGTIDHLDCGLHGLTFLNLAENDLYGNLPRRLPSTLKVVNMAHNLLNGTIEHLSCGLDKLFILNLAENNFSGNLPRCWPTTLRVVNMAHNKLFGAIPSSIGPVPYWIGESLNNLTILRLRSNMFSGKIPLQLMHLTNLQVLDLASNHISGSILQNLEHLNAMASLTDKNNSSYQNFLRTNNEEYYSISISIVMKGLELEFTKTLSFLRSIDLSNNNLTGEIPQSITTLLH
ncbi:hypothetical protein LUZ61_020736 [Rhynchospora tenuis]|uniref:Leucine-rich repeat-containing N-terminal plant-type domain-containing protein n=1 Tax=Rhynchospora tenuis TaxID=198213 RepID=A0AAD5ZDV3_9POAL|nr:hypothetical protein LUZ61_020736 [Rhynchospora tenuis]